MTESIINFTPYINIVEDEKREKFYYCAVCGYKYGSVKENFKYYCLVYDREPKEIQSETYGPDKDWMIYREFYCPGCGIQVEVEATPPGMPILNSTELEF
ncbi:MAG: acetone carboxylase subunit gamma [Thermodesulfobacteriota bacterium]|nr:acetone carboxylase subunit gamma [Thermodesulfobacteriota bacterium]